MSNTFNYNHDHHSKHRYFWQWISVTLIKKQHFTAIYFEVHHLHLLRYRTKAMTVMHCCWLSLHLIKKPCHCLLRPPKNIVKFKKKKRAKYFMHSLFNNRTNEKHKLGYIQCRMFVASGESKSAWSMAWKKTTKKKCWSQQMTQNSVL